MSITSLHLLGGDKDPRMLYAEQSKPSLRERDVSYPLYSRKY